MKGHVRKRNPGVWEINWETGKDEHGKRLRRSKTIYGNKPEANERLAQEIAKVERQRSDARKAGPKDLLVENWLYTWHRTVAVRTTKKGTQKRYLNIIRLHLAPHIGDISLVDLSPRHVDAMHQTLLDEGLDASTIELVHTVISGACNHAVRLEIIHRNPAQVVPPPKKQKIEIKAPHMQPVRDLLRLAEVESHYLFLFIYILVYTGMRRGEAMALRWANVNLLEGYVDVVESVVQDGEGGMRLETPKTERSKRRIFLALCAVRRLFSQLEAQRAERARSAPEKRAQDNDLVFPGKDGGWMKPNSMLRHVKQLGERVGIVDLTFHKFRHFHATISLEADGDLFGTSRELGHSSVATTGDMYGHITDTHLRAISAGFARAMETGAIDTGEDDKSEVFPPDFPPFGVPTGPE